MEIFIKTELQIVHKSMHNEARTRYIILSRVRQTGNKIKNIWAGGKTPYSRPIKKHNSKRIP
jgi:hypothetical protein